ncbi:flavodoxin family protein [Nonomuraea rubra]|uniref:Flavorubredoxin n=1 Tax=Nonomuraea rubra TaxID=46180 RepID=A0A7X0P1C1_9ACTN|nr:flavodoxin domain-containing protein [Nonomuraea rubra]MBB6553435.1 flavorubredoxin [Nonomuraea rubra]
MDALVIYESMYGNTKKIAEAVAEGLATRMRAEVVEVGSAPPQIGKEIALLVVGGPTHAFSMSRASTRQPAAHAVARRLRRLGVRSVAPAESFYVTDIRGALVEGELERARQWGESLAASFPVPAS